MRPLPVVWVASYRLTDLQTYSRTLGTGDCCARIGLGELDVDVVSPISVLDVKTQDSRLETHARAKTYNRRRSARCEVRDARAEELGSYEITKPDRLQQHAEI